MKKVRKQYTGEVLQNMSTYYYDACALDYYKIIKEITNLENKQNSLAITSHLSVGEAHVNTYLKDKFRKNKELPYFMKLVHNMEIANKLRIVGNDHCQDFLLPLLQQFPQLSITDALHLATALRYKCVHFRTSDSVLLRISQKKLSQFCKEFEVPLISISEIKE